MFFFFFVEVGAFAMVVHLKKLLYLFYYSTLQYTQYQMFYFFYHFI